MEEPFSLEELTQVTASRAPANLAADETFWARFAAGYERDESFVQFNYGYYHPALRAVLEVEIATVRELNRRGAHFKLQDTTPLLEAARTELAEFAQVDAGEVALVRSTTEALNVVIQGLALGAGDEVICSDQDYPGMDQVWVRRGREDGIQVRQVSIPLGPGGDDEIVALFAAAITPRTRLLHVTHLIHFTGRVLPVKKLCALARERGVPVMVDAAHSFAQLEFSIRELGCDFLGASLHKWLGAPLGLGLLYVRKDRIAALRPLFADTVTPEDNIRKFERYGNHSDSIFAGLREAIRWHRALGTAVKGARLAHLQRSWMDVVRGWPRFRVLTPREPGQHGAIGALTLDGVAAPTLFDYLLAEHGLLTTVQRPRFGEVLRVTPGMPTSPAHIERLLVALQAAERHLSPR